MTMPGAPVWAPSDPAFRRSEVSAVVGRGEDAWRRAADDVLHWRVKTRSGFLVDGEEAFVLHRDSPDGDIVLTVRSLTRPAPQQPWRVLHPVLRIAQVVARRRYLRALR